MLRQVASVGFLLGAIAMSSQPHSAPSKSDSAGGLTSIPGISVGHHTLTERLTGCTVILATPAAIGGVDVRGSAPGTRETDLLDPVNLVDRVDAIVLAGGSAFGLDAATGVVRFLDERGTGYTLTRGAPPVPIVPAAVLFDLGVGGNPRVRPTADCGYQAARGASADPVPEGNVGAGAGATVGKLAGADRAMKGGIGSASVTMPDGLIVAALVAVNAVGDIVDPGTGRVIAGVRSDDGRALADVRTLLRKGEVPRARPLENTTLGVVATNASLTKTQAAKVSQMAHDGLARTIVPAHTPIDGDTIFTLATGRLEREPNLLQVGALAADVMATAVVRAIRAASSIPGFPAARDLDR
jgi:L-aminopeptidase/D-esterase-like protein